MKICFPDKETPRDFHILKRRVQLEGDTLTDNPQEADLTFAKNPVSTGVCLRPISSLPTVLAQSFGFDVEKQDTGELLIFGKFYSRGAFSEQTIVGIPLAGCLSGGQGKPVSSGTCSNYMHSGKLDSLFAETLFEEYLQESKYTGFVSLGVRMEQGNLFLQTVYLGLPNHLLWNALIGCQGRISELFVGLKPVLKESWVVNLFLCKFPWPNRSEPSSGRTHLSNLTPAVERYFWPFDLKGFNSKSLYTDSDFIGCATSYHKELAEASRLAQRTCKSLGVSSPQFRIDAETVAGAVWYRLKETLRG